MGGGFTQIGGQPRTHIAALNTSGSPLVTDWAPNAIGDDVRALAVSGGTVYAGGRFTAIGGQPRNNLAALSTAEPATATNWTPNSTGDISSLVADGDSLYAGGTFSFGTDGDNSYFAQFNADVPTAPSITDQPANWTATVGQTASFSVTAAGTSPLTYQWRKNGVNISGATSSTYTTPARVAGDNGALYSVVVTNAVGSATSNNATLTVTEAAGGRSSVDSVLVYPNPYVQSRGHTELTIDQLTVGATVKIYSMDGRLVKSLTATEYGKAVWAGVRDDSGEPVASGVYFGVAEGNGSKKNVKIVIQR